MIRYLVKMIEETEKNKKANSVANKKAQNLLDHIKKLVNKMKCKKHPNHINVIKIISRVDKDPKIELTKVCCSDFEKLLNKI